MSLNIVMSINESNIIQSSVTITSILDNSKTCNPSFFFVIDGDDELVKSRLSLYFPNQQQLFHYYNLNAYLEVFRSAPSVHIDNNSSECYKKMLLFNIFNNIDECFYICSDMIVDTDLSLISGRDSIASVVVESFAMENKKTVLSHLYHLDEFNNFVTDPLKYPYFNAGFLRLNLKRCKEEQIWEKIYSLFCKNSSMPFAEQDILNAILGQQYADELDYLPPEYNVFCASTIDHSKGHIGSYYSQEDTIRAYNHPYIYHYAGPEKPWFYPICQYYDKWWYYAEKSPVCEELLNLVSQKWSREVHLHIGTLNQLSQCKEDLQQRRVLKEVTADPCNKPVINFVLTGDGKYTIPLTVVMTSILENTNNNHWCKFYLFVDEFPLEQKNIVKRLLHYYPCSIEFVEMGRYMDLFKAADPSTFENKHVSMACYYRLLIFKLLPDLIDECFYVDGDMIVDTDLSLISGRDSIASVVVESFAMENKKTVLSHLYHLDEFNNFVTDPLKYPYFNAGFLRLNLKRCKEEQIWEKIYSLFCKNSSMPFADQDLLNAILGQQYADELDYLPPEYNVFCASTIDHSKGHIGSYYSQEDTIRAYNHPYIYHYAGPEKPWFYPICQYYDKWWYYAEKSPVCEELLNLVSQKWSREVHLHIGTLGKLHNLETHGMISKIKTLKTKIFEMFHKSDNRSASNVIKDYDCDLSSIFKRINTHKIITFDIFDTLIVRPFADPLDVLRSIERDYDCIGFFDERIRADQKARASHPEKQDITLDEIYSEISEEYLRYKDIECEYELRYAFQNTNIKPLYEYAISKKKIVVLISDMYLPQSLIEAMLKKCGYAGYSSLFVSSSTGKLKRSGDAYKLFLEKYSKYDASSVLHIGDNEELDSIVPSGYGIDCSIVVKNIDSLFSCNERLFNFYNSNKDFNLSMLCGLISMARGKQYDYWTKFGFEFAGPIIFAYTKWLNVEISKLDLDTIYYIARDGYLLIRAMELMYPGKYNCKYVYAPRRVSNICNLDFDTKFSYGDWTSEFADSVYENYLPDVSISKEEWNSLDLSKKNEIICANKDSILNQSRIKKEMYANYIRGISGCNNIALVDSTTTFFSSQKLIQATLDNVHVNGFYWVINSHTYDDGAVKLEDQHSYMPGHQNNIKDWDIMEFVLTSPEPPVIDVDSVGNPVYKDTNADDLRRINVFKSIQSGALQFVEMCVEKNIIEDLNIPPELIERYINDWIDHPSIVDKTNFKPMRLPVRCEHDLYVPVFKPWFKE